MARVSTHCSHHCTCHSSFAGSLQWAAASATVVTICTNAQHVQYRCPMPTSLQCSLLSPLEWYGCVWNRCAPKKEAASQWTNKWKMRLLCLNEGETGARLYLVQNRSNLRPLPTFQLKVAPSDAGDQKEERSWKTQDRPLLPLSLRTAVLNHALLFFFSPVFCLWNFHGCWKGCRDATGTTSSWQLHFTC